MGIFDKIKDLAPQAKQLTQALGLDDKAANTLEELVEKLEAFGSEGKLDSVAQNALTAFKPTLEKFKMDQADLDTLLDKAKTLLNKLSKSDLPGDLEKVCARLSALIK